MSRVNEELETTGVGFTCAVVGLSVGEQGWNNIICVHNLLQCDERFAQRKSHIRSSIVFVVSDIARSLIFDVLFRCRPIAAKFQFTTTLHGPGNAIVQMIGCVDIFLLETFANAVAR